MKSNEYGDNNSITQLKRLHLISEPLSVVPAMRSSVVALWPVSAPTPAFAGPVVAACVEFLSGAFAVDSDSFVGVVVDYEALLDSSS